MGRYNLNGGGMDAALSNDNEVLPQAKLLNNKNDMDVVLLEVRKFNGY